MTEDPKKKKSSIIGLLIVTLLLSAFIIIPLNFLANLGDSSQARESESITEKEKSPWLIDELRITRHSDIHTVNQKFGSPMFSIPKPEAYMGKPAIQCIYKRDNVHFYIFYYRGISYAGRLIDKETYDDLFTESLNY